MKQKGTSNYFERKMGRCPVPSEFCRYFRSVKYYNAEINCEEEWMERIQDKRTGDFYHRAYLHFTREERQCDCFQKFDFCNGHPLAYQKETPEQVAHARAYYQENPPTTLKDYYYATEVELL